jgi:hypothetical protein
VINWSEKMAKRVNRRRVVATEAEDFGNGPQRRGNLVWIAAIGIGVLLLFALLYLNLREPPGIQGIVDFGTMSRGHDDNVVYPDNGLPPAGGVHANTWINCGIYYDPIESRYAVHALEHGAAWITYQPDLPDNEIEELRDYARGRSFMIVSPFPEQRSPVVISSWSYQLEVEEADDPRIERFIEQNRLGPRTPEPGATCGNGTGTPDEM